METAADDELLERARRLCLAARELQLPVLLPGVGTRPRAEDEVGDSTVEATRDHAGRSSNNSNNTGSQRQSTEKLPLITASSSSSAAVAAAIPKHRKQASQSDDSREKRGLEEARRLKEEEKRRHEREIERVKQAQERARARVVRTSQLEQQQSQRAAEQLQSDASSAADECAEKIRRAQESRLRAKERIRMKRQEKAPDTIPSSVAPGAEAGPVKLKAFHRKTIRRLHESNQHVHRIDRGEHQSTPERSEDMDPEQKLIERKLRQETAARLRRMRQQAENQKRHDQEEFEQGLQKYKNRLREMDRVAKGLSKQPSLPQINEVTSFNVEQTSERTSASSPYTQDPSPAHDTPTWSANQDAESSSDSGGPNNVRHPDLSITDATSPQTAETGLGRSRLPTWKRPSVPIQPAQCYSYKAILPAYSRTSVTAPGYSTGSTLGPATRLRAHEISRQCK